MIKKVLKYLATGLFFYFALGMITPFNAMMRERSIKNQISHLHGILTEGYDDQLQLRFPEGKLFSNALLALSIIEYCERYKVSDRQYATMVDQCIQRIRSVECRQVFEANTTPRLGMFYNAWTIWVYNSYKRSELFDFSQLQAIVQDDYAKILQNLYEARKANKGLLDTYPGLSWPADNMIGILSMPDDSVRTQWLDSVFESSSHPSGMIHHSDRDNSIIRASSSAMMTYCLNHLNHPEAAAYNQRYKSIFVDDFLGVQLVKEHEDGSSNMDVDSGPVWLGYGASATIMNIKTQASFGLNEARLTWGIMNTVSLPINLFGTKYFLFHYEPMYDIFMLWSSVEL